MESIEVSIILPVYNGAQFLDRCLVSLLRQTLTGMEILVIDDGSTDDTGKILSSYSTRFGQRLRIFTQKNQGPSAARNLGLREARGTYIGFMDADDWADRDLYLQLLLAAKQEQAELVICGRYDILNDSLPRRYVQRIPNTNYPCASVFEAPGILSETTQFVWDKLFRRDLILKNRLSFQERFRYTEDVLFLCIYKYYCSCIYTLSAPLYFHYQSDLNPAAKYGTSLLHVPEVLEEIFSFYSAKQYFEPARDAFFDLAAKRFLFRVDRFPFMDRKTLQWSFCSRMYPVLKRYFPDWRRRLTFYNKNGFRGGLCFYYRASPLLMRLYIALPNSVKQFWREFRRKNRLFQKTVSERFSAFRNRYRKYTGLFLNAYYCFCQEHLPVKRDCVLIESKGGREPAGNMFALLCESLQQGKTCYCPVKKEYHSRARALFARYFPSANAPHPVRQGGARYYRLLATCGFLFTDSVLPHRFVKRPGQTYVNTWHGVPLKQMGCDVPDRAYAIGEVQRNFLLSDYLLFPNPFMQQKMLSSYLLDGLFPGQILQEAYPRIALLLDDSRRNTLRKELALTKKQMFCYLPTWRGVMTKKQNTKQYTDCLYFLRRLDRLLSDNMLLYVKLHPYAQAGFHPGEYRHICAFPDTYETYDFLSGCDCLITDYSSVFFDFAYTRRKIILFVYDEAEYQKERGLYLALDSLPFPRVHTVDELFTELVCPRSYDDTAFLTRFCPFPGKNAAMRICRFLYHGDSSACQALTPGTPLRLALLYGEQLAPGAEWNRMSRLLQPESIPKDFLPVTAVLSSLLKDNPERLSRLLALSGFLSVDPEVFYTPLEALAYILLEKKQKRLPFLPRYLTRLFAREYRRNFGCLFFPVVILCYTQDLRHNAMFRALPGALVLSASAPAEEVKERLMEYEARNHNLPQCP